MRILFRLFEPEYYFYRAFQCDSFCNYCDERIQVTEEAQFMSIQPNVLPFVRKVTILLLIAGIVFIGHYLILPIYFTQLPAFFYSMTYLGFILIFLSAVFFLLYSLKIQKFVVYVSAIWMTSGTFIFILNQFIYTQFFTDLLLKFFDPLYAILFIAIGIVLLMIEVVSHLYLKSPRRVYA